MKFRGKMAFAPWESTRGEKNRSARLSEDDVRAIRASKLPSAKLAKKYGICVPYVGQIKRRKRWGHVQ